MDISLEDIITGAGGNAGNMREALEIKIVEYGPERVVGTMPLTWKVKQPFGRLHGGASVVLAETLATAGTYQFLDLKVQTAVGLEINANHLRGVSEGMVRGEAVPLHVGRKTVVWDIKIRDDQGKIVCVSRCTVAIIDRYA
jgi:uncharacterized protein (TIGR00369 family)